MPGTPDAPQGTDAPGTCSFSSLCVQPEPHTSLLACFHPVKPERTPLMDIKNGKAALRQKLVSYERMSETMQGQRVLAKCYVCV